VFLYAFDLLELDGEDWRPRLLDERKAKLARLVDKAPAGIQYSPRPTRAVPPHKVWRKVWRGQPELSGK
jgi:ATP-dependent DNA ligase